MKNAHECLIMCIPPMVTRPVSSAGPNVSTLRKSGLCSKPPAGWTIALGRPFSRGSKLPDLRPWSWDV